MARVDLLDGLSNADFHNLDIQIRAYQDFGCFVSEEHAMNPPPDAMKKDSEWLEALIAKNHTPKTEDGELDIFALEIDGHNGPGCVKCGWRCCWHCTRIDEIPDCEAQCRFGLATNRKGSVR